MSSQMMTLKRRGKMEIICLQVGPLCPFSPVFRSMKYIFRLQISCSSTLNYTYNFSVLKKSFYADVILEVKFAVLGKIMTRKMSSQKFVFSNFHCFQNWFAFNLKQFHKYVTHICDQIVSHIIIVDTHISIHT